MFSAAKAAQVMQVMQVMQWKLSQPKVLRVLVEGEEWLVMLQNRSSMKLLLRFWHFQLYFHLSIHSVHFHMSPEPDIAFVFGVIFEDHGSILLLWGLLNVQEIRSQFSQKDAFPQFWVKSYLNVSIECYQKPLTECLRHFFSQKSVQEQCEGYYMELESANCQECIR